MPVASNLERWQYFLIDLINYLQPKGWRFNYRSLDDLRSPSKEWSENGIFPLYCIVQPDRPETEQVTIVIQYPLQARPNTLDILEFPEKYPESVEFTDAFGEEVHRNLLDLRVKGGRAT